MTKMTTLAIVSALLCIACAMPYLRNGEWRTNGLVPIMFMAAALGFAALSP